MPTSRIKALGEVALRVNDLDAMQEFYGRVIGLELMRQFPDSAFFKVADGYGGHTQILALFDRRKEPGYTGLSAAQTTVDHIAFAIALKDYNEERMRLGAFGQREEVAVHAWDHWRSIYVHDPVGT